MLDSSNTNKFTLNHIQQELVKKENRIKHLVSSYNFNIILIKVIDLLERDEVILQMNIARFVILISLPE